MIVAVAANVRGTTPLFLPLSNDQFPRGKNNGATSIPPKADAPLAQILSTKGAS